VPAVSRPFAQLDYALALAIAGLVMIGLIMVYSASVYVSLLQELTPTYYFGRQLGAVLLGLVAIVLLQFIDYRTLRRFSVVAAALTIAGLAAVLILGESILGAKRGLFQGSYQPSEFAKLITVVYIADWLAAKGERIKSFELGFFPFLFLVAILCGLVALQPDVSTTTLIALIAFTMFFVAGARWSHFAILMAGGASVFAGLVAFMPHARQRFMEYVWSLMDPSQAQWHAQQVVYSFALGGLTGRGLGRSFQKTGPLPVPHTDSILAVVGEELGLVGCLVVLALLCVIIYRGYKIALETREDYGRLLAVGITTWLAVQGLVNIAGLTGVGPFSGVPLPFVSYGGSSMLMSLIGVGILLGISQQNKRTEAGMDRPLTGSRATVKGRNGAAVGVSWRNGRTYFTGVGYRR
jgi:cell division protein FtsW